MTALRVAQGRRLGVRRLPVRPIRVRTPLLARAFRNGGPVTFSSVTFPVVLEINTTRTTDLVREIRDSLR